MTEPSLLVISGTAFIAVILLLGMLAGMIHVLTALFPERSEGKDEALFAAINSAAGEAYPGMRVSRIEEVRGGRPPRERGR
jgi:hypothetical protein